MLIIYLANRFLITLNFYKLSGLYFNSMEICLNVSCNSLPFFCNKTVTFLRFAKLYRMLTRCIVFIYTPDAKEMTSLLEFYVTGSYVTKN